MRSESKTSSVTKLHKTDAIHKSKGVSSQVDMKGQ